MKKIPKVMVLTEVRHEYVRKLLRGIAKYARLNGPWKFFLERSASRSHEKSFDNIRTAKEAIKSLEKFQLDGIIMFEQKFAQEMKDHPEAHNDDLSLTMFITEDSDTLGLVAYYHPCDKSVWIYCEWNDYGKMLKLLNEYDFENQIRPDIIR